MAAAETGIAAIFKAYGAYILGIIAVATGYGSLRQSVKQNTSDIEELKRHEAAMNAKVENWKASANEDLNKIYREQSALREDIKSLPLELIETMKNLGLLK